MQINRGCVRANRETVLSDSCTVTLDTRRVSCSSASVGSNVRGVSCDLGRQGRNLTGEGSDGVAVGADASLESGEECWAS